MKRVETYNRNSEVYIARNVFLREVEAPPTVTTTEHDFDTNYDAGDEINDDTFETFYFSLVDEATGVAVTIRHEGVLKAASNIPLRVHPNDTNWAEIFWITPVNPCTCRATLDFTKPDRNDAIIEEWVIQII